MGSSHLPCHIVGVFSGQYQLYCSQDFLITSFCATELTPLASGSFISLANWRQAPKVSLRSVADDPALLECCNCDIPVCSGSIVISSASEEENEAPNLWVNNGAYSLSHRDRGMILSERGWLTENIICAAQMLLLQFFPNKDCNILYCRRCVHFRSTLGSSYRLYTSETNTGVLCPRLVVKVKLSTCTTACINLRLKN